jgi:hypothetical protein
MTLLQHFHGERKYQLFVKSVNLIRKKEPVDFVIGELTTLEWVNTVGLEDLGDDY